MEKDTERRISKLNTNRENAEAVEENTEIYRKECRRNKLTPRFSKHKIRTNGKVTVTTTSDRKIHKSKIKRKRKIKV